jgi:hypothetical protein
MGEVEVGFRGPLVARLIGGRVEPLAGGHGPGLPGWIDMDGRIAWTKHILGTLCFKNGCSYKELEGLRCQVDFSRSEFKLRWVNCFLTIMLPNAAHSEARFVFNT